MLLTIISWIYIGIICLGVGLLGQRAIRIVTNETETGFVHVIITGVVILTVYAEYFSIFYKVGALAHIIGLIGAVFGLLTQKTSVRPFIQEAKRLEPAELLYLGLLVLILAFYASRGTFHTDTGIYHAQAIRLIEEYGSVRGLGNLQVHYAYNSAYICFCALFTMRWILPQALHTTTGFLALIASGYAMHLFFRDGISAFKKMHGACAAATLIYTVSVLSGSMSPATDYGTLYLAAYLLCAVSDCIAHKTAMERESYHYRLGLLAVLALFLVSMKLSTAGMVLIALIPAISWIRQKKFSRLFRFIVLGFLIFLPYLIRNVILSGWLVYPVAAIDLFPVPWKIPLAYLQLDNANIKVWGRALYDPALASMPFSAWFPIWWSEQQHYVQMLMYAQFMGVVLFLFRLGSILRLKKSPDADVVMLVISILSTIAIWLFTAPAVRFGLIYLLAFPLMAVGLTAEVITRTRPFGYAIGLGIMLLTLLCYCAWLDNYIMDDFVFLKQRIREPYYLTQKPFDNPPMKAVAAGEDTIYLAEEEDRSSYHVFPATTYSMMWERSELMGERFTDGLRAR